MAQYGFFFGESHCIDCRACVVGCRDWYNMPRGALKQARMFSWESGTYPATKLDLLFAPCHHCANLVCVDAAQGALHKEETYGAVLIDPQKETQPYLRAAAATCPYGPISFETDAPNARAVQCTMCINKLTGGKLPVCVTVCPMRALDFGTMDSMTSKYRKNMQLEGMPSPNATSPSVVFKPQVAKTNLPPYDSTKALSLMMKRSGLPNTFSSPGDLTPASPT